MWDQFSFAARQLLQLLTIFSFLFSLTLKSFGERLSFWSHLSICDPFAADWVFFTWSTSQKSCRSQATSLNSHWIPVIKFHFSLQLQGLEYWMLVARASHLLFAFGFIYWEGLSSFSKGSHVLRLFKSCWQNSVFPLLGQSDRLLCVLNMQFYANFLYAQKEWSKVVS